MLLLCGSAWGATAVGSAGAAVRQYWISAENMEWDVAPNGGDPLTGARLDPATRRFMATVYRRYTRDFGRPWPDTARMGDNDGIPGPTIRARVGDTVLVHFRNRDRHHRLPHSMHFHAFRYAPSSDGAFIPYRSGRGGAVPVGGRFTYRLRAVRDSVGIWPYHDHSPSMHRSLELGLYGQIIVRGPGESEPDREQIMYFAKHAGFDTINGRAHIGNTPTYRARVGEDVEWNVIALGSEFHVFHLHGHRWMRNGVPTDSELLGPSTTLRVRQREDAAGTWFVHCHVESHMSNGMMALYRVTR